MTTPNYDERCRAVTLENQDQATPGDIDRLLQTISSARFRTYLQAAGFDEVKALQLYLWNAKPGEAFHLPLQAIEVALRNAVNRALIGLFGAEWWCDLQYLRVINDREKEDIDQAIRRIERRKLPLITDQVVAGLSFGFWRASVETRYNTAIWSKRLRISFPDLSNDRTLKSVSANINQIVGLRNRISHQEPIFQRQLTADFGRIMDTLGWISRPKRDWIRPHCRVMDILRQKP